MKGFFAEFKEFISKGSVLDMAIGIIIGGAFTAIVNSLVDNIIMPLISVITGGVSFTEWNLVVGSAKVEFGVFIGAVVNFLLVAFVLFCVIKAINKARDVAGKTPEEEEPAPVKISGSNTLPLLYFQTGRLKAQPAAKIPQILDH